MLFLLRHAESEPSPDIVEPEWPLSENGRRQAVRIVPVLRWCGIDVMYSSPYRRARETVAPFARASGLGVRTHEGLRERRLTERFLDDVETPARKTWSDFSWSMSDGESNETAQRRFVATVSCILGRHAGQTILISTHGTVTALFLHAIDERVGVEDWAALDMPDLIRIHRSHRTGRRTAVGTKTGMLWDRVGLPTTPST